MFKPDTLYSFSDSNPIKRQYDRSIQASQQGRFDNYNKRMRFSLLHQLAGRAGTLFPELNAAECGCWLGHTTHILASVLASTGFRGRLSVFDSFDGLSEFTEFDKTPERHTPEQLAAARLLFKSDVSHVASVVSDFDFVDLYPGWIPSRFAEVSDRRFSFVSIDVDLYDPIRASTEFFYDRLAEGGFMYFDDYGYEEFPGARRAVDEMLPAMHPAFFLEAPCGGAFLIK